MLLAHHGGTAIPARIPNGEIWCELRNEWSRIAAHVGAIIEKWRFFLIYAVLWYRDLSWQQANADSLMSTTVVRPH